PVSQNDDLIFDPAPLSDEHRACCEPAQRLKFERSPRMRSGGYPLEQAAGGRFKPAQRPLLQTVGHRPQQQVTAETGRRLAVIERPPARLQLFDIERLERSDLTGKLLSLTF